MIVLHGNWIPSINEGFIQDGDFWIWIEERPEGEVSLCPSSGAGLDKARTILILEEQLGLILSPYERRFHFGTHRLGFLREPPHASESLTESVPDFRDINTYRLSKPFAQIAALLGTPVLSNGTRVLIGEDLSFWVHVLSRVQGLFEADRYIPVACAGQMVPLEDTSHYIGWTWVPEPGDPFPADLGRRMPGRCRLLHDRLYDAGDLVRHCSEVLLHRAVSRALPPPSILKKIRGTVMDSAFEDPATSVSHPGSLRLDQVGAWEAWRREVSIQSDQLHHTLSFQLVEAESEHHFWRIDVGVVWATDPSRHIPIDQCWSDPSLNTSPISDVNTAPLGEILQSLGRAARIFSPLLEGMKGGVPHSIQISIEDAFVFLERDAWILEEAGFRVMVPSWWTPQGRRKTRIRLRGPGASGPVSSRRIGLDLQHITNYRYELALGDEPVSESDWLHLVESKSPLVRFRGEWMVLDRKRMNEMLSFWRRHREGEHSLSLLDLLKVTAEDGDFLEIDPREALHDMLGKLRDYRTITPEPDPSGLRASLRTYQQRGLAWIVFLEQLGMNGCLADDMGLGKTIQVLALLLREVNQGLDSTQTLLIAPTSVIGNWRVEIERFAPSLKAYVHHGIERVRETTAFAERIKGQNIIITSYALARRDEKLLSGFSWFRVVLDEAQNIKNPASAQTKSILKLKSQHRLALTGTPVENRLLDLWSIFNFLNGGYLGRQSQFRAGFEIPIQRDNDSQRAETLRRMIQPFVLRRVKTDPEIIRDLPEKIENRQYCQLSLEQASLYEAVVRDIEGQLQRSEGISRQGLILSTLTRLKQICNHPAHFLHDGSRFSNDRSPKLERLCEMLAEVIAEGESALVFSQFAEAGAALERHLRSTLGCPVFYLHGAVPRGQRERLIEEFQNEQTGPAVFVLSLRAGGLGITLTRANHVFHFDRWWNPAVEDQATDRAFRIGQNRNVMVHKFIAVGTLEERIDRLIEEKKEVASMIVSNDESWLSKLDNETFKALIALNRESAIA
jgi:SNF2 family DNA or RNA helicase